MPIRSLSHSPHTYCLGLFYWWFMKNLKAALLAAGISGAVALSGAVLIAPHEGKVNEVYLDPANILTSCYGHTGKELKPGMKFSDDQCLQQLAGDLVEHNKQLLSVVKVPLSEGEHAAYLSFVYNVGIGQFRKSTLLANLNEGFRVSACNQLMRWIYIKGKESNGLRTRRAAERKMCLKDLQQ